MISGNILTDNNIGVSLFNSTITVSGNTITNNQVGISYYKSDSTTTSGNTITNNSIADTSQIDTTGVVIQNNIWNCGPASLATVLNNMGVNATQDELASLAETDKSGTSMYGLAHATQVKGLDATGAILSVDQIKPNYIVLLLTVNGLHYSVITRITNTTVYLADSSFGNINITLEDFKTVYSGYSLIISHNSTSNTVNGTVLTNEQMQNIKGTADPVTTIIGGAIAVGEIGIGTLCMAGATVLGIGVIFAQPVGAGEDAYWNNWRKAHSSHNTIYVGGGGYSYSYSYSYPHGHNTRSKPLKYKPYVPPVYKYGLYVATGTGWTYKTYTTTSNPAVKKDQQIYKQYLIKRAGEIAKITGLTETYLEKQPFYPDPNKENEKLNAKKEALKDFEKRMYPGDDINPWDPDDPWLVQMREFFNNCGKKVKSGGNKLRSGDIKGGLWDITYGTYGLWIAGPLLALNEAIPKK